MTKLLPLTIGEKTQYYILHRVYIFGTLVAFEHEVYYTETSLSGASLMYKLAFKVQQNYSSSSHWTFIALTTLLATAVRMSIRYILCVAISTMVLDGGIIDLVMVFDAILTSRQITMRNYSVCMRI